MSSQYPKFDLSRLVLRPLVDRINDLDINCIKPLTPSRVLHKDLKTVASRIIRVTRSTPRRATILMMGAHVIRSGVQRYLINLMERGYITCLAMNGAGAIHDFEFALVGGTTESVSRYISEGQFGLWRETGLINELVSLAAADGLGLGEGLGKAIHEGEFPYKNLSILAAAFRNSVPATVHVGIGYDIVHEHPNCNGSAYGATSFSDFLIFARALESCDGGVIMNFGSAVMAPEVFLKALAMVRNVAGQEGRRINNFTTLVCDLRPLPSLYHSEPSKKNPAYYFRPWKTMLVRTISEGGESFYVQGDHKDTIPQLWTAIVLEDR